MSAFSHLLSRHMDKGAANDIVRDIHDSPGWNRQFQEGGLFEGDPRHLLLQFCQDGMNPFDMRKNTYSMTPQLVKIMNLPLTAREKLGFLLLVGMIHGPREPKNVNPYVEPIVDELLLLLEGVWAFDGLKKEAFKLRAKVLLWVLDFVGLCKCGKTKGPGAISACSKCWIQGRYSHTLSKTVYTGARRNLDSDDPMRKDVHNFPDKTVEDRGPPRSRTAEEMDVIADVCDPETTALPKTLLGNVQKATGKTGKEEWRRLPTYSHESYVVDMMHTSTDVIQKVQGVTCGSDDTAAVRKEEKRLGRFPECWEETEDDQWEDIEETNERPVLSSKKKRKGNAQRNTGGTMKPGPWTLTKEDKKKADDRSSAVKVPVNFGWRPRPFFERIYNMKSHDWKQLVSHGIYKFCIRGLMKDAQRETVYLLCDVLHALCAPYVNMTRLPELKKAIHQCLARLERDFPVTIMTAIVHWMSHITPYISEYGPTKTYWMYLYERMNSFLSKRVKNRQHPESTAVESYRVYDFVLYMSLAGFLPEGAVPTTTAEHMALLEAEEDGEPEPTPQTCTEVSGAAQKITLTREQTTQLDDYHIKHTPKYQSLRKQLRAKYLKSPSTTPFSKWSSPRLDSEECAALAGPSPEGTKYLRAKREFGVEYRCKEAETMSGTVVSSYVGVDGQQMGSQVDVGRVNFFFKHSFLGEEFFLANVTWLPTATRDPESGLLRSDLDTVRHQATETSFCKLSSLSHPLVTARDPDDPNALWILNFDNPYTCSPKN
ncbi:uncharacterized protein LOC118424238 [Branchiostoma floridae]|uniref:Uncharacterized protein LOC118424238 n=1 Tax=Branchiostoma floridae TaxID=7739 RepID=A0A9J7LT88_BRAFL|nr:uncharacterized protein LOC118424238 [Branchiostoma floridae]